MSDFAQANRELNELAMTYSVTQDIGVRTHMLAILYDHVTFIDDDGALEKMGRARGERYEQGSVKERYLHDFILFPLLGASGASAVYPHSLFLDVVMDVIERYDPRRGAAFVSALRFTLAARRADAFAPAGKRYQVDSLDRPAPGSADDGGDGEGGQTLVDTIPDEGDPYEQGEFAAYMQMARLVAERKKQERHLPKAQRGYFEGFFTFDTAKQAKDGVLCEDDLVSEEGTLFPIMEHVVLKYLMLGEFSSMRDVARNPLRDAGLLGRRNEAMRVCYGLSKPTVISRNRRYYEEFVNALAA